MYRLGIVINDMVKKIESALKQGAICEDRTERTYSLNTFSRLLDISENVSQELADWEVKNGLIDRKRDNKFRMITADHIDYLRRKISRESNKDY